MEKVVGSNEFAVKEIVADLKKEFSKFHASKVFLKFKIGEKIETSLNTVIKKFAEQEIKLDIDIIRAEFQNNTFLKKLTWDTEILTEKYGHLIYSQNLRTISSQFKKLLISKFGAQEIKIENVTRINVTKLLEEIINIADSFYNNFTQEGMIEIKKVIQNYASKYKLKVKNL